MNHPLTRRGFLSGAAGAGAFTIMKSETAFGSQANSKVTIGVIGTGGRGSHDGRYMNAHPNGRVTAVCDKFDDRIESGITTMKAEQPTVYKDWEKLLASDVDAVLIATPPFLHPPMFEAAVEARKHIFCEKPMGVDTEGCQRVIKAARRADPSKNIAVGFQQRYGKEYKEAFRRIQSGELGDIVVARAAWIGADPFKFTPYDDPAVHKLRNWFAFKAYSGDFIVEQDCHNFDVLHWFLGGLPERAIGRGGRKVRLNMEILDHLSLMFEFPNKLLVNYEANQLTPRGFNRVGEEFTGTKGTITTSRGRIVHIKGQKEEERETLEAKRDITQDAVDDFITRIVNNTPENVGERSALSTMIAILGRTAVYSGKETTWKQLFG